MALETQPDRPAPSLRTVQTIAISLVVGVSLFLAITIFLNGLPGQAQPKPAALPEIEADLEPKAEVPPATDNLPIISIVAAFFFVSSLAIRSIVTRSTRENSLKQLAAESTNEPGRSSPPASAANAYPTDLLAVWQTERIVDMAIIEGATFLGAVAYFVENHWIGLAVAVVGLLTLIYQFPTVSRLEAWMQEQHDRLGQMRAFPQP